ncbi:HEAT repeat domain-containing protein [Undibacterium sp. TJN19]|uniref:HEAT repeat domain-containing protein n=1 Tax=Undibacterium sp. TJN19 TaxID=3413055 RepID=UPI003BF1E49F
MKFIRSDLIGFSLLLTTLLVSHLAYGETTHQSGTAKLIVSLVTDKPVVMLGEPVWLSLKVKNVSKKEMGILVGGDYQNKYARPDSFALSVLDNHGVVIPSEEVFNMGGMTRIQELQAGQEYVFRLLLSDWVKIEKAGVYKIKASKRLAIRFPPYQKQLEVNDIDISEKLSVTMTATDMPRMGVDIAAWANTILADSENDYALKPVEESQKALAAISDNRAIPYLLKILKLPSYSKKFFALSNLAKYDSDEAVAALKGMVDVGNDELQDRAVWRASDISLVPALQVQAFHLLSESPRPANRQFVLEHRHSQIDEFRLTAVNMLIKHPSEVSSRYLAEMRDDSSPLIREQIKRYFSDEVTRQNAASTVPLTEK